jgi:hypothetical protein
MKKLVVLIAILIVPFGLVLADEDGKTPPAPSETAADLESTSPPESPANEETDTSSCEYKSAKELLDEWMAKPRQPVSIPDCPVEEEDCSGGNLCIGTATCGVSGTADYEDTGLQKCRKSQGVVSCNQGQTVHIQTNPCAWCPCCSDPMPCHCGPCGQFVRLVCQ